MTPATKRLLFWSPRAICILFAMFISLFAMDVFEGHDSVFEMLLALLIHLIPTFFLVGVLILAWRWEWVGALVFALLGSIYIAGVWGRFPISTYVLISGPLFLIAFLFYFNWLRHAELRDR